MMAVVPLLLIGVAFCFDPATSNCIKDGKEGNKSAPGCLQKAMAEKNEAVDGVIQFLCLYMKYKDMANKEELVKASEYLEEATGCSTEDIFGSDTSLEQVALDKNGVLTNQIITMRQLLKNHVPLPITTTVCTLLNDMGALPDFVTQTNEGAVKGNKRTTRNVLELVGGLTGSLSGITGLLKLLALIGRVVKLLEPVLTLLDNLLGVVTGLLGGGQKQGDLLGNLLGGLIGGLTGGLLGGGSGGSNLLGLLGR